MTTSMRALPLPQQAGILCNDPRFQSFAGTRTVQTGVQLNATATAEYLRTVCRIASRKDLATNTFAAKRFEAMRTDYDAWRGRVARPRDD